MKTEIYLGLNRPNGENPITEIEFNQFLNTYVTPLFSGYTVYSGIGYWLGGMEQSKTIVILHNNTLDEITNIQRIVDMYIRKFNQQGIIRADIPCNVTFTD